MKLRSGVVLLGFLLLAPAPGRTSPAVTFPECEELFASNPQAEESARCFFDKGGKKSLSRMEQILSRSPDLHWFSFYAGYLSWSFVAEPGDLHSRKATFHFRNAARQFAALGMARDEVESRYSLYYFYSLDRTRAKAEVDRVREAAAASSDPRISAVAQLLEARYLSSIQSDLDRAYVLLEKARTVLFQEKHADFYRDALYAYQKDCLMGLGNVGIELGKYADASRAFRQVTDLAIERGAAGDEASARYGQVRTTLEMMAEDPQSGSPEKVRQLIGEAKEARQAAATAGAWTTEANSLWILAMLSRGREARAYLDDCISVSSVSRDRPKTESSCRNAEARYFTHEDPGKAKAAAERAVELARQTGDTVSIAHALRERMRASWEVDPMQTAIESSRAALGTIEDLRKKQKDSEGEAELFSTWADDYLWLSGRLLDAYRGSEEPYLLDEAFAVTEEMRAKTLRDQLQAEKIPALAQVRQAIGPREALLSFQVAPWKDWSGDFGGGSWLLVLTSKDSRIYRLPDRAELRQKVKTLNGLVKRPPGSQPDTAISQTAAALYKVLLAEALSDLPPGIEKLIVVPDDALYQLPFSLLRAEPRSKPLAELYELSLEPSATLWRHWKSRPQPAYQTPALVLASPFPVPAGKELPYAEREGRKIRNRLSGSELLLGEEASEASLRSTDLSRFGILHFATHSEVDPVHPERSFVQLAQSPPEDGRLQAQEIQKLSLGGHIVVLASCTSAGGRMLRGEGVMSLARSFFLADASTVVASLWPQRDDEAARLFDRFYRHLAKGDSVAAALRNAQSDRIAAGAPASAWSGFVVLGDGDRVPLPGGVRHAALPPLTWGGLLLSAGLALFLWLKLSRGRKPS